METVLAGLQWDYVVLYIDDIIAFAYSFQKHLEKVYATTTTCDITAYYTIIY